MLIVLEEAEMSFGKGAYVRLIVAPNTRMGIISKGVDEGKPCFVFHQDERFDDTIPDMYVFDYDIEECERPSDEQIALINALAKRGRQGTLAGA
jgi:hypothetical protein